MFKTLHGYNVLASVVWCVCSYGVSKILAIEHAPLDHVVWLDCDAFPVKDLASDP